MAKCFKCAKPIVADELMLEDHLKGETSEIKCCQDVPELNEIFFAICQLCAASEIHLDECIDLYLIENLKWENMNTDLKQANSIVQLKVQLDELEKEESSLEAKLLELEHELSSQSDSLLKSDKEIETLWIEIQSTFRELTLMKIEVKSCTDYNISSKNLIAKYKQSFDNLNQHVLFSAFEINLEISSINWCYLGCQNDSCAEWNNMNAAFSQIALLIHALDRFLNIRTKPYEIIPFGIESFIRSERDFFLPGENIQKDEILPLFRQKTASEEHTKRFNSGLQILLDSIEKIAIKLSELQGAPVKLPFQISGKEIGKDVFLLFQNERTMNEWNEALRRFLVNLSFCRDKAIQIKKK